MYAQTTLLLNNPERGDSSKKWLILYAGETVKSPYERGVLIEWGLLQHSFIDRVYQLRKENDSLKLDLKRVAEYYRGFETVQKSTDSLHMLRIKECERNRMQSAIYAKEVILRSKISLDSMQVLSEQTINKFKYLYEDEKRNNERREKRRLLKTVMFTSAGIALGFVGGVFLMKP